MSRLLEEGTFQVCTSWDKITNSVYVDNYCALSGQYELTLIQVDASSRNVNFSGAAGPNDEAAFAIQVSSPVLSSSLSNVPNGWLFNLNFILANASDPATNPSDLRIQTNIALTGPTYVASLQGRLPLQFYYNRNGDLTPGAATTPLSQVAYPVLLPMTDFNSIFTTRFPQGLLIFTFRYKKVYS
jgi:hypothetical protein